MSRKKKERPYNMGNWTSASFNAFIKSLLRKGSMSWKPRSECIKRARVRRGVYKCVGYKRKAHEVTASVKINGKREKNHFADHINPVVDPKTGFVSWDEVIKRMFCELDGFQLLCKECHDRKTKDERAIRNGGK